MKLDEKNYVDLAEEAIRKLLEKKDRRGNPVKLVTTSKIRNLLAMTSDIYNDVVGANNEKLTDEVIGRINYLKLRFLYEAGRDGGVKDLVMGAQILDHLNDIRDSRRQFILFSRYMEALVAYRKYLGAEAGDRDSE